MKLYTFSGSSSVHHQEFIHCTLSNGICHKGFEDSFRAGPVVLLASCLQTYMTYTIAECTVNKLLMMDRGTARKRVEFHAGVNLGNWCIWLVLL